jgi:tRNA G18 (ribose-2'-O)-methylase SpoU
MAIECIDGPDDPRIAEYRDLPDPQAVRSRGLFVAEGRLVVRRVIESERWRLRSVLVNEAACRTLRDAFGRLLACVTIFLARTADFRSITGFNIHRGCLALVERPLPASAPELVAGGGTIVVLEDVTNADNVGGVFRNAAALGASGVLLSPACCDPLYRKAVRTSMGAVLSVPFAGASPWPGVLSRLSAAGFTIVALTPHEQSETLDHFAARRPASKLALLIGGEGTGLTPAAEAAADVSVRIPMRRGVDSLNLAVAAGIALYALSRSAVL